MFILLQNPLISPCMKKNFRISIIGIVVFVCSCGNNGGQTEDISWLVGRWQGTDINTVIFSETWQREGKGMIGFGCSMSPEGDTLFKENLKIDVVEGVPFYIVTIPPKKEPTLFKLIHGDDHNAIFENKENNFPQRISYLLQKDNSLKIKLEGIEKGQPKIETLEYVKTKNENLNLQPNQKTNNDTGPKPISIKIQ